MEKIVVRRLLGIVLVEKAGGPVRKMLIHVRKRIVGLHGSRGTKVFCLTGKVVNTGLVEMSFGTPAGRIVIDVVIGGERNLTR